MIASISKSILYLFGWSIEETALKDENHIIIGAPHTSNWDFPLGVLCLSALNIRFKWVAKHTLFKGPLKYIFRPLSGIPLNRSFCSSFIKEISKTIQNDNHLNIAIMPEGTRSKEAYWKIGFYYLALKGNVPIALGYIDYKNKTLGIGKVFYATGDIEKDMMMIRAFYSNKTGRYPSKQSHISISNKDVLKINELASNMSRTN